MCVARMAEAVKNVTVLSRTICSCAGDRLMQKMSLYVESYDYVEVYNVVWSLLECSGMVCERSCSYNFFCLRLQAELNQMPYQIGWNKKFFVYGII